MDKLSKQKPEYRLEDLQVHEVSVVDKPANLRPFLIVKRKEGGVQVTLEENMPNVTADGSIMDILELAGLDVTTKDSSDVSEKINTLLAGFTKAATAVKQFGEDELAPETKQEIADLAKSAADLAGSFTAPKEDDSLEVTKEEGEDGEILLVVKRGAKMKKSRLEAFRKAVATLKSVLEELEGSAPDEKSRGGKPMKKEQDQELAPATTEDSKAGVQKEETTEAKPTEVKAEEVQKEEPKEEPKDNEPSVAEVLAKGFETMAKTLSEQFDKKLEEVSKKVDELGSVAVSKGDSDVEETVEVEKSEEKPGIWNNLFRGLR